MYPALLLRACSDRTRSYSDNVSGADNQQERLDGYIARLMAVGHHRTKSGFSRLLDEALSMNGEGRFRSVRWKDVIGSDPESSETVRRTRRVMPP